MLFQLAPARRKAFSQAVDSVPFVSHCARDDAQELALKMKQSMEQPPSLAVHTQRIPAVGKMKVAELRQALTAAGLKRTGLKQALKQRLVEHLGNTCAASPNAPMAMASAAEAALEKIQAGENRAIEHVALVDDKAEAVIQAKRPCKRKQRTESKAIPKQALEKNKRSKKNSEHIPAMAAVTISELPEAVVQAALLFTYRIPRASRCHSIAIVRRWITTRACRTGAVPTTYKKKKKWLLKAVRKMIGATADGLIPLTQRQFKELHSRKRLRQSINAVVVLH
jgi:hypothetical protein